MEVGRAALDLEAGRMDFVCWADMGICLPENCVGCSKREERSTHQDHRINLLTRQNQL